MFQKRRNFYCSACVFVSRNCGKHATPLSTLGVRGKMASLKIRLEKACYSRQYPATNNVTRMHQTERPSQASAVASQPPVKLRGQTALHKGRLSSACVFDQMLKRPRDPIQSYSLYKNVFIRVINCVIKVTECKMRELTQ